MSQGIDIDAFRKGYNARMGIGDEAPVQPAPAPELPAADVAEAESVAPDSITDMGEVETIDLSVPNTAQPGTTLPTDTVVDVLSTWKSPTDARADFEAASLPQTLHALHNSLNVNPFELKDLADRAGLTYSVVDADSGFARKKISSDRHAEAMRGFMDNISQTPKTAAFVRQADSLEQLALTSDVALAALEKELDPAQQGFFESGYIGAARNAWNNGMLSREVGDLAVKWMDGSITDDERSWLDVLRQAQAYYQNRRESMGLLERMVRGTVEALGVPLAGGVEGAVQFLGRYGKEGLAGGAMVGAGFGSAAGGVGAVPGAIMGGVTGLSAVAQAGFMNDMMRQEGAQTFLSLVDMGVPEDTARVLAIAAGAAKGLLEYVGLREVGKVFPGAERFLTREAAVTALNTLKRNPSIAAALGDAGLAALRGIAGETGTEVLQESVDIAAEEAGRRLSGVNRAAPTWGEIGARLADTAIETIESTALVAGAGGAARGARHYAVANKRENLLAQLQEAQSRTLDTVAQAAQNSPVMRDMVGTGEALMQHLADEGVTPETVYIRPEAVQQIFFQEENPELMATAADMGITPESLQENLTLGTDVAVDFAKATRHIMADPQRYAALKPDMRLEPSMLTDAEVEELSAMNQDAEARLAYLDNLLAPVSEEAQAAQTRYEQRMETAAPYVEQLRAAGYSENQANAYGLVLAANAERMAPVFGMTPQEYLAQRFAGYHSMTQEEFERLASGGLDGLFENRELAAMLQDMGVTKNMSRSRKRRQLQPEFDYAYGRVDAESVKNLYGQERVNELRRQFGPGFFAKKGEGTPLDVLAQNYAREERGGYELGAEEIDADAFAEKIFAPHDEFEAGLAGQLRQRMLWQEEEKQYPDNGKAVATIPKEIAQQLRLNKSGAVVLDDRAISHIKERHGKQLSQMGYNSPHDFINFVLRNLNAVYSVGEDSGRKYDFVSWAMKPQARVMLRLEFDAQGDYYRIVTASPVRRSQYKKRTPLWESAPHSQAENSNSVENPPRVTGQSGVGINLTRPAPNGNTLYQLDEVLYSGGQTRARGAMSRLPDGRAVVGLFKSKNASTVLHETAHFWLEELREAAQLDTAPDWVRDAWDKLQKAYGFEGALNGLGDVARWTEVQERFAREFEAYAREGKAPSWELQSAFNRFRNWLTEIYRSVRAVLGLDEVNEDVREVFDALLATQEEIEQSRRAATADSVMDLLDEKETTPELLDRYARAVQRAYENASAAIANRRLVDRRAAEKEIRQQVTADIDGSETYTMLARLREGGLDFDALKAAISEDVAYRLREKWHAARGEGKALIRKGGTLDLLDVAAQFDRDSVQGLAGALLDTPTRREAIGAEVERRLAQWDAQYDAEVEYSNAWDEALAVELEALTGQRQISPAQLRQQMDERTGVIPMAKVDAEYAALKAALAREEYNAESAKAQARREQKRVNAAYRLGYATGRQKPEAAAAKAQAEARSAHEQLAEERADFTEQQTALRKKTREKLAALKEQERLRRAALGAAYRARNERNNIIRQLRRIGNSKSVPYEYMQQIRRLLQRWDGLGTKGQKLNPATLRKLPSLQEFLAQKSADSLFDEPLTAPDWLLEDGGGRFADLSLAQMRDVKRLIQELAHAGSTEGRMLADKEKREIKAVADECAAAAGQLSARDYISDRAGVLDTIRGALRKGLSSLTSMRFLARALDGFTDHGVNHDAWLMPLQQARTEELTLQREMEEKLRAALTPLLRVGHLQKAFAVDDVPLMQDVSRQWGGMWDMDKVYSVALNMGNEGNLKALMRGYGWSEEHLRAITGRLSAEEWQAVQAVWDAIDTLYPRLNDVYKTLKGVPLPKVKAQPFTVQTADGQTLTLKGGYYPLIFDQRLSDKAAENQSVDELLNGMEAVLRSPNPKSGMTKERKGGTLPPKLSLTVLDRHVTDTVHYVTHALPLRDTMRLFREPSFKEAFIRAAGQENYDQILPWLRGIARPGGEQAQGIVAAIDWLARRGSLYALGANMKSALLQLTSIGNSWSEVGFGNFLRAAATMLSAPRQSWETVREKSAYMQNRARLLDDTLRREYEDMRGRGVRGVSFGERRFSLDVVRQAQLGLMIALDAVVAYPTWLAAYDKAIARGIDEARAVAEADGAVVAAQGGGGPLDTPAVMRQAGLMRALCPFMSFALSDFNRKMETLRGFAEWAKTGHSAVTPARLFRDFALQWVMPVTLSVLMVSLGRDGEPPEGEDFLWEALTFYTMGIPIARDVAKQAESYFSSEGYKGGRTPLMLAGLDNAVRGLGHAWKAWDEGDPDAEYRAMKETLNAVGFVLGLGTPQIWRTLEGSEAYWIDDEGGPLAPLLGKPKK